MLALDPKADFDLCEQIADHIRDRTYGAVQHVAVAVAGPEIVIRGLATTFYLKQLATQAAVEITAERPLRNEITVA